jgi:fluoroacetyl-CoA thioesterase
MTTLQFGVTDQDTAIALGSGDVPVLATPRILAWMEAATVAAAADALDPGSTTVGVEVFLTHRRATAVGAQVEVEVLEVGELDRGLAFEVVARQVSGAPADAREGQQGGSGAGTVLATARVVRAVVERQAFLQRL